MEYTLHILQIKLWEWEGIKEHWDIEINKSAPDDHLVKFYYNADARVAELKEAISLLSKITKI